MEKKILKREIFITADGSTSIHLPEWDEQYHSRHGAIQEAYHVFIRSGLDLFQGELTILEIGFGTGLNAFITLLEAESRKLNIDYIGVEAYPVAIDEVAKLNYPKELNAKANLFTDLHEAPWNEKVSITTNFSLDKKQIHFENIAIKNQFDLIYFDAFGARLQPELWTEVIFERMYRALKSQGYLVTYSAKGSVRRAMQAVGFEVERLPGPPGKREMLRARKG
jgi:tRNA U34 5-methylaminomethyl-2-thiouridine-forming methyltransferase MnmC